MLRSQRKYPSEWVRTEDLQRIRMPDGIRWRQTVSGDRVIFIRMGLNRRVIRVSIRLGLDELIFMSWG